MFFSYIRIEEILTFYKGDIAHGITLKKGQDNNVRSAWHGLRCFSSGRSPLMMRLRILVIVVGNM